MRNSDLLVWREAGGYIPTYCYMTITGETLYAHRSGQLWKLVGIPPGSGNYAARFVGFHGGVGAELHRFIFTEPDPYLWTLVRRGRKLFAVDPVYPDQLHPLRWVRCAAINLALDTIASL